MTLTSKHLKTHRPAYVDKVLDGFENGILDLALLKYLGQEHKDTFAQSDKWLYRSSWAESPCVHMVWACNTNYLRACVPSFRIIWIYQH